MSFTILSACLTKVDTVYLQMKSELTVKVNQNQIMFQMIQNFVFFLK